MFHAFAFEGFDKDVGALSGLVRGVAGNKILLGRGDGPDGVGSGFRKDIGDAERLAAEES